MTFKTKKNQRPIIFLKHQAWAEAKLIHVWTQPKAQLLKWGHATRILIYGLIYTVQNKQNMLDQPGVEPIKMKRSEFLDAKHIRPVLFVCHKTSDMIFDLH